MAGRISEVVRFTIASMSANVTETFSTENAVITEIYAISCLLVRATWSYRTILRYNAVAIRISHVSLFTKAALSALLSTKDGLLVVLASQRA